MHKRENKRDFRRLFSIISLLTLGIAILLFPFFKHHANEIPLNPLSTFCVQARANLVLAGLSNTMDYLVPEPLQEVKREAVSLLLNYE